jgi:hypothetical protein
MITASNDNVRLMFNDNFSGGQVKFSHTRSTPILNDPSEYKLALDNFISVIPSEEKHNTIMYRFYSNNIPVSGTLTAGNQNERQLLFEYVFNNFSDNTATYISFMPDNYHFYNLYSNTPLYTTDLFVTKVSNTGVETPLTSDFFSCTLLFQKLK